MHTNFRLSAGGDYLALVEPDGQTIATQFAPAYPQQLTDVSYGVRMDAGERLLVSASSPAQVFVPTDESLGVDWTEETFVPDAAWLTDATAAIGYETDSGFAADIQTDIGPQMAGINSSVYVRIPFELSDPGQIDTLFLRAKYDDGFIAYLNGEIVSLQNAAVLSILRFDRKRRTRQC